MCFRRVLEAFYYISGSSKKITERTVQMQIKTVTPPILNAAVSMLQPFAPELSPNALMDAIRTYDQATNAKPSCNIEKPLTRRDVATLLGCSLNTINRYLNSGRLQKIRLTPRSIRITSASVKALLSGTATESVSA